jgi:hypothetical protein
MITRFDGDDTVEYHRHYFRRPTFYQRCKDRAWWLFVYPCLLAAYPFRRAFFLLFIGEKDDDQDPETYEQFFERIMLEKQMSEVNEGE